MIGIIIVLLIVLWLFYELHWKRRNLPPGPCPLPLLGNLHTVKKFEPGYDAFLKWRQEYGPVYTFWLGPIPLVLICDYPTIKQTFVMDGESYVDKYKFGDLNLEYKGGDYGVIEVNGDHWRDHRRFALQQLRDFGLNKDGMEQRILLEADCACKDMKKLCTGEEIDMRTVLDVAVGSVVQQLTFGHRFDENNIHLFHRLKKMMDEQMKKTTNLLVTLIVILPFLKKMPYFGPFWADVMSFRDKTYAYFTEQIEAHEKEINFEDERSTDYVEAYLKEKRKREAQGDFESFSMPQLINMCVDLWLAGLETTTNSLSWLVVFLLNHPDVQDKIHEEMDRVIGSDRTITMADKINLPYTAAVMMETQRVANILPTNLPHKTTREAKIGDFTVPAGTGVIAQISAVLYDESVFPDAKTFNPSRFIDENGMLRKCEEFIPFSIGKRQCLGEGLARMELFLLAANILNRFKVSPTDPANPPTMKKTFSATIGPQSSKCIISTRY